MTRANKQASSQIDEITAQWQRERPDLDLSKLLLAVYLQRLGRMIEQDFERYCQTEFKLRSADMRVLLALRRVGPPYAKRPTDLFRSLLVTSGAITKQVDRLEKRKLVKRLPDPSYGGGFLVQLTERGGKIVDKVVAGLAAGSAVAPAISALSAQERDAAQRFCYRVIALIETSAAQEGRPIKPARRVRGKKTARPALAEQRLA